MGESQETILQKIEQLFKDKKPQEALEYLERFKPVTNLETFKAKILTLRILNDLKREREIVFDDELFEEAQRLNRHYILIDSIIDVVNTLIEYDNTIDAFTLLNKGELLIKDLSEQSEERLRCSDRIYFSKGRVYWKAGDLDKAKKSWEESFKIRQAMGDYKRAMSCYNNIGIIYWSKGQLDKALEVFKKCLEEGEGDNLSVANYLTNIGLVYRGQGKLDEALKYHHQALTIREELGNKSAIGDSLSNIGSVLRSKGELEAALDYHLRSRDIKKDLGNKNNIAIDCDEIGRIHFEKGDLNEALSAFMEALTLRVEINQSQHLGDSFDNIGLIYHAKGEMETAYEYLTKALIQRKEIGNDIEISKTLFNLVVLTVETENIEKAKKFLMELTEIQADHKNPVILQRYQLSTAIILKKRDRFQEIAEAQRIFLEVARSDVVRHDLTIFATLNLCDLLLLELQTFSGKMEILIEIKKWFTKLLHISKIQNSFSLMVRVYLLKSKLALLELNVPEAELLLTQAALTAEEKGLSRQVLLISGEQDTLRHQLDKWNDLINRNASFLERVELAQVNQIIKGMIQRRVEDVSALPLFAVEQIRVSLFKMSMTGPTVVVSESLPYTSEDFQILTQMCLFYIFSLGQGQSAEQNIGLFGPLPIPTVPDHIGLVYAFFIKDPEYKDPRVAETTYALISFSMPESLGHHFSDRERISDVIHNFLAQFSEINDLMLPILVSLKYKILGIEKPT